MLITAVTFTALIKSSWFEDRKRPLPIYGPPGNDFMPSTTEFVSDLFGDHGAYRYLSELLVPGEGGSYLMQPHNVVASSTPVVAFRSGDITASAVRVIHGGVPALAWRVEIGGKSVVFSGDTNGEGEGLVTGWQKMPICSSRTTPCRKAPRESRGSCTCLHR